MWLMRCIMHVLHPMLSCRDDVVDETEMMRRQMNPMANNMAFDADTAFKTERTALAAVRASQQPVQLSEVHHSPTSLES
jgi:hypothetical protein